MISRVVNRNGTGRTTKRLLFSVLPKLLLLAVFLQLTNDGVFRNYRLLIERGELLGAGYFLLIWGTSLLAVGLVAFLPRLRWRLFWALLFCASAVAGKAFQNVMGSDLTLSDVHLLWQARGNFADAFEFYRGDLQVAGLSMLAGLAAILWPLPSYPQWLRKLLGGMSWVPMLPVFAVLAVIYNHKHYPQGLPQQIAPPVLAGVFVANHLSRLDMGAQAGSVALLPRHGEKQVRHIVLLLDESIRGDFIDLNLRRDTTPYLLSLVPRLANFGIAASGANCSAHSNAILRFGAQRHRLPDNLFDGPTVWQFAQAAGFRTVFVDAQQTGGGLQNFMHAGELAWIDEFIQFDGVEKQWRDMKVADTLKGLLARDTPSLIYINKVGVHFPYGQTYPPDAALFLPQLGPREAAGESRERLINSYKNGVRWAVDAFFRRLFEDLDLSDSVIVYSSDHGQHLMESAFPGTHCRTESPHAAEGIVPLVVFTDEPRLRTQFHAAAELNHNQASHFNIFPTLLQLLGFETAAVRRTYGPGLRETIDDELAFTTGGMIPGIGSRPKWVAVSSDYLRRQDAAAAF